MDVTGTENPESRGDDKNSVELSRKEGDCLSRVDL